MSRFVIPEGEVDDRWLRWWSYLVPSPGETLGLSPFGDWFLLQNGASVWRLDLLEGRFGPLGVSAAQFWDGLEGTQAQDDWLQVGFVLGLERKGFVRQPGQCYTYRIPPRIGGSLTLDNMVLGPTAGYQLFCAQLHQQLDSLPNGAVVTRLDVDQDGVLHVRWRHGR